MLKQLASLIQNMTITALFQCGFHLRMIILAYLCTDRCNCMTFPKPRNTVTLPGISHEGLTSSIDTGVFTKYDVYENDNGNNKRDESRFRYKVL